MVQKLVPLRYDIDPNVPVANAIAEALEADGRVSPIVWGLSDPVFRAWREDRRVRGRDANPSMSDVLETARANRVRFRLIVQAMVDDGMIDAKLELYEGSDAKPIWTRNERVGVQLAGGLDLENATSTLANNVASQLGQGPFRRFPSRRASPPPAPTPRPPVDEPKPPATQDDEAIRRAGEMLAAGKAGDAIALLRDAVDSEPLNARRRGALARTLLAAGQISEAAEEARRAADIAPSDLGLRLIAVRAWLRLGRADEAARDAGEAERIAPDSNEVMRLLAEVALWKLDAPIALSWYDRALAGEASFEGRLGRAAAKALAGDPEGVREDLNARPGADSRSQEDAYVAMLPWLSRAVTAVGDRLREGLQAIRVRPRDAGVLTSLRLAQRQTRGLLAFLEGLTAPGRHSASHERRLLAHKLLIQSASEALAFAESGDENLDGEATLNLGEALRQYAALAELVERERLAPALIWTLSPNSFCCSFSSPPLRPVWLGC